MSKALVAVWEELRWGQRSRVISDPASLRSVNMGSDFGLEIYNHSWHIQHLHTGCFHLWSKNNLLVAPPTPPPGPLGWPCPWAKALNTSPAAVALQPCIPPAAFPAPLTGTFFFAVGSSCRCVIVLVAPLWLLYRQTLRLSSTPVLWVWFRASKCLLDP